HMFHDKHATPLHDSLCRGVKTRTRVPGRRTAAKNTSCKAKRQMLSKRCQWTPAGRLCEALGSRRTTPDAGGWKVVATGGAHTGDGRLRPILGFYAATSGCGIQMPALYKPGRANAYAADPRGRSRLVCIPATGSYFRLILPAFTSSNDISV